MLGHNIVLPLPFAEVHDGNLLLFGQPFHARHEAFGYRVHERRGGECVAAMAAEEFHDSALTLQGRNVHVEVHPVDALQFERDVMIEDLGYALW